MDNEGDVAWRDVRVGDGPSALGICLGDDLIQCAARGRRWGAGVSWDCAVQRP